MPPKALVCLALISLALSCKKQAPPPVDGFSLPAGQGAFIINEGNFMWSNASLDYWDIERDTLYRSVYQTVHPDVLGDVFQSLYLEGETAWLVLNNSGKVIAVDIQTLEKKVVITGLTAPRYVQPVGKYVFITDIYHDKLTICQRNDGTQVKELPMSGWTEELIVVDGQVWVTNKASDYLALIDIASLTIADTLTTRSGPTFLEKDQLGNVWVLSAGDGSDPPALQAFEPGNSTPLKEWLFPLGPAPANLAINGAGDQLYYTYDGGLYTFSIHEQTLPAAPLAHLSTQALYGMEVDPYGRGIYVLDALSFAQPGTITHYSLQGDSLRSFIVGMIPNSMEFR